MDYKINENDLIKNQTPDTSKTTLSMQSHLTDMLSTPLDTPEPQNYNPESPENDGFGRVV